MKNVTVRDIMTSPVITTRSHVVITDFISLLVKHQISGLPVVDDNNRLTGIVTRSDLLFSELKRELNSLYEKTIENIFNEYNASENWQAFSEMIETFNRTITVNDLMTADVITASEDAKVNEICSIMKNNRIKHIIITKDNDIHGIITSSDIISYNSIHLN